MAAALDGTIPRRELAATILQMAGAQHHVEYEPALTGQDVLARRAIALDWARPQSERQLAAHQAAHGYALLALGQDGVLATVDDVDRNLGLIWGRPVIGQTFKLDDVASFRQALDALAAGNLTILTRLMQDPATPDATHVPEELLHLR
jgi:hypothetical protein